MRFLDIGQVFSEFLKIHRLRDFSRILWDFSENSSRFPEDFSKLLRISSNYLRCFKIFQDFSRFLRISQGFARFFKVSRDFFKISQNFWRFLNISQDSPIYLDVYRFWDFEIPRFLKISSRHSWGFSTFLKIFQNFLKFTSYEITQEFSEISPKILRDFLNISQDFSEFLQIT